MLEEACGYAQVTVSASLVTPEKLHAGSGPHGGRSSSVSQTELSVSRSGSYSCSGFHYVSLTSTLTII